MASWDVFHGDRLELERGLTSSAIREALARGELFDDDLVRPAGTTVAWVRLADIPEILEPAETLSSPQSAAPPSPTSDSVSPRPGKPASAPVPVDFEFQPEEDSDQRSAHLSPTVPAPGWLELSDESDDVSFPVIQDETPEPKSRPRGLAPPEPPPAPIWRWEDEDDDDEEDEDVLDDDIEVEDELGSSDLEILDDDLDLGSPPDPDRKPGEASRSSRVALPVATSRDLDDSQIEMDEEDDEDEDEDEEDFTLIRSGPQTVEELDLAPMVDVAFQLVLFFMVTATTVLYKTLEIPKPTAETPPSAVTQGRTRTLDDFKDDYIIVEIDSAGAMKIDREPVAADMNTLVERLRTAREKTGRKAMLLSADYATKHRNSVLAYDAANEIGLVPVIARPARPQGPGPNPFATTPGAAPPPRAANPAATSPPN